MTEAQDEQLGEDPEILAEIAEATKKLTALLQRHEAARLIIDEGAEPPEPPTVRCPRCNELLDCLVGSYPASVPGRACIVDGELYIDAVDSIRVGDCIEGDVETWHCPHCDASLFVAGETRDMATFLREGVFKEGKGGDLCKWS